MGDVPHIVCYAVLICSWHAFQVPLTLSLAILAAKWRLDSSLKLMFLNRYFLFLWKILHTAEIFKVGVLSPYHRIEFSCC